MPGVFADVRGAIRALRSTRLAAAVAVLSLALGIGATTALFTILDSLVFKTLPVREPDRLVSIEGGPWTYPIWAEIQSRAALFDGAFAWASRRFDLAEGGESVFVDGAYVSGGTFEVLGVPPALGRTLRRADDARGGGQEGPVAVISHRFWQRRFGGRADVVGQTLRLQHVPVTVVGVTPADFFGPEVGRVADVMVPFGVEPLIAGEGSALDRRSTWWITIYVRLQPGQSMEAAASTLRGVQGQIKAATVPQHWTAEDQADYLEDPLAFESAATGRSQLRGRYLRPLTTLLVAMGLVLTIACANIANLLIARALARRHELAVRLALGASRWRLGRQLLFESAVLAACGAALGLAVAHWASRALVSQLSTPVSSTSLDLSIDWRVLLFTTGVAALTALIFGIAPAASVSRLSPHDVLAVRGQGGKHGRRSIVRQSLVVAQVALSLTLVVGAGLFARTFWSLSTATVGFDAERILVVNIDTRRARVPVANRRVFVERLREAAAATPGVAGAAVSFTSPVSGSSWNTDLIVPEGVAPTGPGRHPWVNTVTPGFFAVYGTPIVSGRDFTPFDRDGAPLVAVVNQTFAREFLSPGPPVGQRVRQRENADIAEFTVVGVVRDSVYQSLRAGNQAIMYLPRAQQPEDTFPCLSVRAADGIDAGSLARSVSVAMTAVDPNLALTLRPLAAQLSQSLSQERLVATLSSLIGGLALMLAGLGLFGVTAHGVAQRRTEMAIRIALGARPGRVVALVLRRVGWTVVLGVAAGAALTWWASRFVSTLLHGVDARDPITFASAALVLALVAGMAAWIPARRAATVDPALTVKN